MPDMNTINQDIKAPIFAISRLRMGTDGKGITTLVTFMGCPLNCKYCINPKCHEPIYEKDGTTPRKGVMLLTPYELYNIVKVDNLYFQATGGGVCFGGGEPTLHEAFIKEFKQLCGDKWKITLETSLSCSFSTIRELSTAVDHWIVDIKTMDPRIYESYTGCNYSIIQLLTSLKRLVPKDRVTIKIPLIPDYNDMEDVERSIERIERLLGFDNIVTCQYIKTNDHE